MEAVKSDIGPKTSVIVISYNNFYTTTGPCLNSLKGLSGNKWEIIVVDNGSKDGTQEHLADYASQNPNISIKLNIENRGFAGGNNDGVKLATGKVIILLNSDTLASSKALQSLSQKLIEHDDWGMVGPVTNEAGNEQQVYFDEQGSNKIITQGEVWCRNAANSHIETDSLVFFCVAMRRDLYTKLGGLDEGYGVGFYEDADFCAKAIKFGQKLVIAEDVFVYHHGSASFSQLANIKKLLRKNKKIFAGKNSMSPNVKHVREKLLDVMRIYTRDTDSNKEAVAYRFDNRMRLATSLMPNNFFRQFFYRKELDLLKKDFILAKNG